MGTTNVRRVRVVTTVNPNAVDAFVLGQEVATLARASSRVDAFALADELADLFDRAVDLTVGTDIPTDDTTGPVKTSVQSLYTGAQTINTANTSIVDRLVDKVIDVRAAGFYSTNCTYIGPSSVPSGNRFLISFDNAPTSGTRGVVEDCLIQPQTPSLYTTGFAGHHFRARRIRFKDVVDSFIVRFPSSPDSVLDFQVLSCYADDYAYFSPDPTHSDNQSHNDGIQLQGGDGTGSLIQGNLLNGRRYSATAGTGNAPDRGTGTEDNGRYAQGSYVGIQYTDLSGYTTNLDVLDNWIFGFVRGMSAATANNVDVGRWYRNRIDDAQGERASGGSLAAGMGRGFAVDATTTLDAGESTSNKNVYVATATGIAAGTAATIYRNQ